MDEDLGTLTVDELRAEVRRLPAGIGEHRDPTGHDLCWHHPDLWALLPERVQPSIEVPEWSRSMRGCVAHRQSLDPQAPDATRVDRGYPDTSGADDAGS